VEVAVGLLSGVVIAKTPVALVLICNYVEDYAFLATGWRRNPAGILR
jgi:uncharacterized membrane protein